MSQERKAENLTDFAEMVFRMTEDERISLLNRHYQRKEPSLKDILIVPQLSVSREPLSSSKKSQGRSGPEVIRLFSCSTQLSMKFQLLIKTKILTNKEVSCFKSLRCCINHANKC